MTQFDQLKQQVKILYAQLRLQKSLRLTLRAVWIGLAGVWLGWALHAIWGILPDPSSWFSISLGLAVIPIIMVVIALYPVLTDLSPPAQWIYALDSRLHLREQLSTAWEIAQTKRGGPVADLLVADILALLPGARAQILAGGWYRKRDLAAAGVAAILSCMLLTSIFLRPTPPPAAAAPTLEIPQTAPEQLQIPPVSPTPGQQPNGSGSQPGDMQNGQNGSNPSDNPSDSGSSTTAKPGSSTGTDSGAVANALRQLGQDLSRQAGTYDLGQALQNLNMNSAADALGKINDQIDDLSPESRKNLSQAMQNAAKGMDQAKSPSVAKDMQNAADALKEPSAAPNDALGKVAQDFRQLDGAMQASQSGGGGAGQGKSGGSANQAKPADRLPNENGEMEIPLDNPNQSGLLSPADPNTPGEGTASGSLDANRPQQDSANQSPLLPNSFLWKWRNVVSQYFQR